MATGNKEKKLRQTRTKLAGAGVKSKNKRGQCMDKAKVIIAELELEIKEATSTVVYINGIMRPKANEFIELIKALGVKTKKGWKPAFKPDTIGYELATIIECADRSNRNKLVGLGKEISSVSPSGFALNAEGNNLKIHGRVPS